MIVVGLLLILIGYLVPRAPDGLVPVGWVFVIVGLLLLLIQGPVVY